MKKSTIITIWVAISLMFFGGILAVSTYAISGGNIGVYYENGRFNSGRVSNGIYSNNKIIKESAEFSDISSLDISSDIGEIKIAPGDTGGKFIVNYSYPSNQASTSCNADGGVIKFSSHNRVNGTYFNLFGSNSFNSDNCGVTITYPQGTVFNTISISANLGSISIENTEADKIAVRAELGEIYCKDVTSSSFSSTASAGKTYIKKSQLGRAEIESSLGEIVADDIRTSSLDISSSAGSVTVNGALSGKTEIESSLGSVSVETSLPKADYNLDLEVNLGSVSVNGRHEGNNVNENNNAANTMQIQSEAGSVSVDFK